MEVYTSPLWIRTFYISGTAWSFLIKLWSKISSICTCTICNLSIPLIIYWTCSRRKKISFFNFQIYNLQRGCSLTNEDYRCGNQFNQLDQMAICFRSVNFKIGTWPKRWCHLLSASIKGYNWLFNFIPYACVNSLQY